MSKLSVNSEVSKLPLTILSFIHQTLSLKNQGYIVIQFCNCSMENCLWTKDKLTALWVIYRDCRSCLPKYVLNNEMPTSKLTGSWNEVNVKGNNKIWHVSLQQSTQGHVRVQYNEDLIVLFSLQSFSVLQFSVSADTNNKSPTD